MRPSFVVLFTTIFAGVAGTCAAQSIISARSGTLHYTQGEILLDGKVLDSRPAMFPDLKANVELRTSLGRAEVLLTPGVFLRIGEDSAIRMIDKRLTDTRVELLEGSAIVENDSSSLERDGFSVTIVYKDHEIQLGKAGVLEISAAGVRVYSGDALVTTAGNEVAVKDGRALNFASMLVEKFDTKMGDELYVWTKDRSTVLAAATMSSASSAARSYAGLARNNTWYYNAMLGTYSYLPGAGAWMSMSPFGYSLYSVNAFNNYYDPGYYWTGGGGTRTSTTSVGVNLDSLKMPRSLASSLQRLTAGTQNPPFGVHLRTPAPVAFDAMNNSAMQAGYNNSGSSSGASGSVAVSTPMAVAAPALSTQAPAAAPAASSGPPSGTHSR